MERMVVTTEMWKNELFKQFKDSVVADYQVINKNKGRVHVFDPPTNFLKRNSCPILIVFRDMDFSKISLSGIRLFRTLFINCRMPIKMTGVNLMNARFHKCEFLNVTYHNVDFALARFEDCRFRDSYFERCDFGSGFATTTFSYDTFKDCSFFETSMTKRSSFINCEFYSCKHMNSFSDIESCWDLSIRNKFIECGKTLGTRSIFKVKESKIKDPTASDGIEIEYTIVHQFVKPKF